MEREPKRMISLKDPNTYHGFSTIGVESTYVDKHTSGLVEDMNGYFVNGVLNLNDGTFMHGFHISELPN